MGAASNKTERDVLGLYLNADTSVTTEPRLWLALFNTIPAEDNTGGVEPAHASYARQEMLPSGDVPDGRFTITSGVWPVRGVTNSGVDFGVASGAWGTISGAGIYNNALSGDLLWFVGISGAPTEILANQSVSFPSGQLFVEIGSGAMEQQFAEEALRWGLTGSGVAPPSATTMFLGLSTTTPSGNQTGYTEPSVDFYGRTSIGVSGSDRFTITEGNPTTATNADPVVFLQAAGGSWGTITHAFITTALEVGHENTRFHVALDPAKTVASGEIFLVRASGIEVTCE